MHSHHGLHSHALTHRVAFRAIVVAKMRDLFVFACTQCAPYFKSDTDKVIVLGPDAIICIHSVVNSTANSLRWPHLRPMRVWAKCIFSYFLYSNIGRHYRWLTDRCRIGPEFAVGQNVQIKGNRKFNLNSTCTQKIEFALLLLWCFSP